MNKLPGFIFIVCNNGASAFININEIAALEPNEYGVKIATSGNFVIQAKCELQTILDDIAAARGDLMQVKVDGFKNFFVHVKSHAEEYVPGSYPTMTLELFDSEITLLESELVTLKKQRDDYIANKVGNFDESEHS